MILGEIKTINNTSGAYNFVDKDGHKKQEIFEIINLKEQTDIEQKHFDKFGGAMSPYEKGEKVGTLRLTDSLLKLDNVKGYIESIILHELSDYDNHEHSMLESEIFVMNKIQDANYLTTEEKNKIINHHVGFFQNNKLYFESLFKEFWESYYKDHKEEYDDVMFHYKKICGVVDYLKGMIK